VTDRLRVLVVDHTGDLGGAELALVRACEALGDHVTVRVLLFEDGPLRGRLEQAGVRVDVLPISRAVGGMDRRRAGRLSPRHVVTAVRVAAYGVRLTGRLRRLRPDVVHTTSLKADLVTLVPARLTRTPLVWHVHDRIADDYLPPRLVRLVRRAARVPQAVVVNSRATAATLPVETVLAYPGYAPGQASAPRAAAPAGPPVVGIVGRLSPTKGQLELVRATPAILARHPDARVRVVGAPTFGAEEHAELLHSEAVRLGVSDHVEWVGFRADTAAELDEMTVCVHASPVPEPFGQVVVEAMVRGVPVVATRAGGVTEILAPDGEPTGEPLGLLVPPGDVDALAAAVIEVLDDPAAAARRGRAAFASASERFPVARTAATLTRTWRRVAGVPYPGPRP